MSKNVSKSTLFEGGGHFEAKYLVEGLRLTSIYMDRYIKNDFATNLPLKLFKQRNFVADSFAKN